MASKMQKKEVDSRKSSSGECFDPIIEQEPAFEADIEKAYLELLGIRNLPTSATTLDPKGSRGFSHALPGLPDDPD